MPSSPPDGFAEFVENRSKSLLRSAWLLTGDAGRAEDLLQTALARTWPRWQRVNAGGNPEAYVRKVLHTTYLSWWRRRWRGEMPTSEPPDAAWSDDIESDYASRDAVRRALAGLTPAQRSVVVLRFVEDLSVAETAAALGCSEGTVKTHTSRALAALRRSPTLEGIS
jgi:RNA polymerase sigma-70 factor (sigma-E family)